VRFGFSWQSFRWNNFEITEALSSGFGMVGRATILYGLAAIFILGENNIDFLT